MGDWYYLTNPLATYENPKLIAVWGTTTTTTTTTTTATTAVASATGNSQRDVRV